MAEDDSFLYHEVAFFPIHNKGFESIQKTRLGSSSIHAQPVFEHLIGERKWKVIFLGCVIQLMIVDTNMPSSDLPLQDEFILLILYYGHSSLLRDNLERAYPRTIERSRSSPSSFFCFFNLDGKGPSLSVSPLVKLSVADCGRAKKGGSCVLIHDLVVMEKVGALVLGVLLWLIVESIWEYCLRNSLRCWTSISHIPFPTEEAEGVGSRKREEEGGERKEEEEGEREGGEKEGSRRGRRGRRGKKRGDRGREKGGVRGGERIEEGKEREEREEGRGVGERGRVEERKEESRRKKERGKGEEREGEDMGGGGRGEEKGGGRRERELREGEKGKVGERGEK
ncbi:hypothetical protein Tco_0520205 [Tanacetum coccineum]